MSQVTMIGLVAGSLTTASFLPQLIKTYRSKRCDDLSLGMLLLFCSGVTLWLVYGVMVDATAIVVANGLTLALELPLVVMKLRYRALPAGTVAS